MPRPLLLCLFAAAGCLPFPPGHDFDGDGWTWPEDCADDDASIHPGAEDFAYDGVDQDCDGASDYDKDGDGYDSSAYAGEDCDDSDPVVNPGATEIWYDGVDQDCDGADDYDQDGDGVDTATDCDDTDPTVYPGADEGWYDGVDQDCDGRSDYDQDRDGFDCLAGVSKGCPEASSGDDCDDLVPAVHPGARETINEVDEDCDGDVDEVPWGGEPTPIGDLGEGLWGEGGPRYGFGAAVSGTAADVASLADLGDKELLVDRDGAADLLVSAPLGGFFGGASGTYEQAVYLVAGGSPADLSGADVLDRTVLRIEAQGDTAIFGSEVAWVPSVDGDEIPEILVGAPPAVAAAGLGVACLYRSVEWNEAAMVPTAEGSVHALSGGVGALIIASGVVGDGFGSAASMPGWDEAGGAGVAVTAPRADAAEEDGYGWVEPGRVFVFEQAALGDMGRHALGTAEAGLVITGSAQAQHVGDAVPVLVDLDPDGVPELVVSSPLAAEGAGMLGALSAGDGDGEREVDFLDLPLWASGVTVLGLGMGLAGGGDLDGDGYGDVVAQATDTSGDVRLEVISGQLWTSAVDWRLPNVRLAEIDGLRPATGMETVSFDLDDDFNGDWYADLVVGAAEGEQAEGGGYVALLYGQPLIPATLSAQSMQVQLTGSASEWLGYTSVAGADITDDGLPELLLGAPGRDTDPTNMQRTGMLYLLDPLAAW